MMWFKLFFCLLGGFVLASHNPGWEHNQEYVYQVRGRILTSLNEISNDYTGILLKGQLIVRPSSDGHLKAKLPKLQYAEIHSKLQNHWIEDIPEGKLSYEEIPLSSKPFKIVLEHNVVKDIIVEKSISNWESNMIKGIVSQLQLDTAAENQIRSSINIFTQDDSQTAVFKTMEKTITGETETLYEIHPFPAYTLEETPVCEQKLSRNGKFIEVIKTKNFTHARENPSYHFGFQGAKGFDVANKIGEFFSRTSVTQFLLCGDLKNFVIQSAVTIDQVTIDPNMQDQQRGLSGSVLNITLEEIKQQSQEFEEISKPINVGIVYSYNHPFDESNAPRSKSFRESQSSESQESSEEQSNKRRPKRESYSELTSSESGGQIEPELLDRVQEQPHLNEAPASPLLPLTVGYDGKAISMKQNIRETVRTLAKKIGQEFQQPEAIPKQNTVGKFLMLSSLVRVMNHQEMQTVGNQLYTQEQNGPDCGAWVAYRDAVSQAGTGPGLLTIQDWIREKKLSDEEAAQAVASAAHSVRQPTEKYMHSFFEMIQNEELMTRKHFNESLLLSYTTLAREVYVDRKSSHDKYPVHSFGTFNSAQGRLFVQEKLIPFLGAKLQEAIKKADTQQIHVCIRALGNLGHRQILRVFKPYLEGDEKVSHFQRVLMVMALDRLVETHTKSARSVLYRIYRNSKDVEEVRVAAVYQLMRANPSPDMLQRMAIYTNTDPSNHVNSAVKSSIEALSEMEVPHLEKIREAAQSAKALLTSEEFGLQHSKSFLQNYIVREMKNMQVKQITETFGGYDSVMPKGIKYLLRGNDGGVTHSIVNLQSMVSSVDDLVDVLQRQTKQFRRLLKQKQSFESVKTKWSSENTARLLNLQNEQREQLEGYLYLHLDEMQKVLSFDNNTIEEMTQMLRELEKELQDGKKLRYNRMAVNPEMALSFPNAWGLPFIYTYDRPMLFHMENQIKATAKPSLYSSEGIQKPESIEIEFQVQGFASGRSQSQFGFFAPFNHKRYSAGYDKNFQIWVPQVNGKVSINVEHRQTLIETWLSEQNKDFTFLHFSSWPYTSQHEIYSTNRKTKIVQKEKPHHVDTLFGDRKTGIAFNLQMTSDEIIDYGMIYKYLEKKDFTSALLAPWLSDNVQHVELNLGVDASRTTTRKMIVHLGHQDKYFPGLHSRREFLDRLSHLSVVAKESWERQNDFLKKSSQDISNVHSQVGDATVVFEGAKTLKYSATLAGARSNIDSKSRILMQAQHHDENGKPVKVSLTANGKIPNPPALNAKAALEFDPTSTVELQGKLEWQNQQPTELNAEIKMWQSEERKEYLMKQQVWEQCQKEMQQGNTQLPACEWITAQANLLDRISAEIDHKNIEPKLLNQTYKLYSVLRHYLYPRIEENIVANRDSDKDRFKIKASFSPALDEISASVQCEFGRVEVRNVPVSNWAKQLLVPHPVFNVYNRLQSCILRNPTYHRTCVVDEESVNTLDNRTYPASLGQDWVVMAHQVPRHPSSIKNQPELSVVDQLNQEIETNVIYARATSSNNKEVKLVIQSPKTMGRVIDITLKPSNEASKHPRLFVQNEEVIYDDLGSHVYDSYMQVYKLPNQELQVEVYDSFGLAFDGKRIKLSIFNDKFRDATRGLCGTFTGEEETDFTYPGNCIIRNPEVFVASNTVPEKTRTKRMNDMLMIQSEDKKCYQKSAGFSRVVSAQDTGVEYESKTSSMRFKTLTMEDEEQNQICFSIKPYLSCRPQLVEEEDVEMHCLRITNSVRLMKQHVESGAQQHFKNKTVNKVVKMSVIKKCQE